MDASEIHTHIHHLDFSDCVADDSQQRTALSFLSANSTLPSSQPASICSQMRFRSARRYFWPQCISSLSVIQPTQFSVWLQTLLLCTWFYLWFVWLDCTFVCTHPCLLHTYMDTPMHGFACLDWCNSSYLLPCTSAHDELAFALHIGDMVYIHDLISLCERERWYNALAS